MTDTDSLIATVKRGIDRAGRDWREHSGFADVPDGVLAKAAIAAVRLWEAENGWRCVPVEPDHASIRAASESKAKDDEGEFVSLGDHIDYSGENKTHTVIREALRCAIAASPPPPGSVKEQRE